jgi:hypothetical protein
VTSDALVSSANKYICVPALVTSGMSLMYKTNNIGPSTDPVVFHWSHLSILIFHHLLRDNRTYEMKRTIQ